MQVNVIYDSVGYIATANEFFERVRAGGIRRLEFNPVHLTIAYFVPDPQVRAALADAARRGVDVQLVLPGKTGSWAVFYAGRAHYDELLRAGVRIYERRDAALHSKTASIDGNLD